MKKWQKIGMLGNKKCVIRQIIELFPKISKNNGFSKLLGHVSPTFDDSNDPLGNKKHLGQLDSLLWASSGPGGPCSPGGPSNPPWQFL